MIAGSLITARSESAARSENTARSLCAAASRLTDSARWQVALSLKLVCEAPVLKPTSRLLTRPSPWKQVWFFRDVQDTYDEIVESCVWTRTWWAGASAEVRAVRLRLLLLKLSLMVLLRASRVAGSLAWSRACDYTHLCRESTSLQVRALGEVVWFPALQVRARTNQRDCAAAVLVARFYAPT